MGQILQVNDLHVYYGSIHAVKGVSFEVNEGEVVTLIGANGAGKSTVLNTVSGLLHPKHGSVVFEGKDLKGVPAHKIVEHGLAQVPEGRHVFLQMTVEDNLEMGAYTQPNSTIEAGIADVYERFPRLKERRKQIAGTLSGGEQQMLAMGRALMSKPKLLMLDEPSMGLAPILVEQIFDIIRELHAAGTTILLVEQNAQAALSVADRAYVLETGRITLSGTGKELVARAIALSQYIPFDAKSRKFRTAYPDCFRPVHLSALPQTMLESELFGYEPGAFTGANATRKGRFELANSGTLFLDEVGELSLMTQAKLLRVLQESVVERIGGTKPIPIDIRVICATNKNIEQMVEEGAFREDLYYRLNVVSIQVPSLQERSEDIPLLAEHFLKVFGERNRKDVKGFTPKAMDMLVKYPWPGNVRELENAVERAVVLLFGSYVSERELPLAVTQAYEQEDDTEPSSLSVPLEGATLEDVEREAILRMLDSVGDNKSEAAKRLGISRKTLHTKLKRYGQEQD